VWGGGVRRERTRENKTSLYRAYDWQTQSIHDRGTSHWSSSLPFHLSTPSEYFCDGKHVMTILTAQTKTELNQAQNKESRMKRKDNIDIHFTLYTCMHHSKNSIHC
jgi:hypothetical protein